MNSSPSPNRRNAAELVERLVKAGSHLRIAEACEPDAVLAAKIHESVEAVCDAIQFLSAPEAPAGVEWVSKAAEKCAKTVADLLTMHGIPVAKRGKMEAILAEEYTNIIRNSAPHAPSDSADKARLDWLENEFAFVRLESEDEASVPYWVVYAPEGRDGKYAELARGITPREALDSAMQSAPKPPCSGTEEKT